MTRHARNCTAGAVYTYHEKQKDTRSCGYGTQQERIGKDSVKDFDCCCLTLQPCRYPVITPDGFIYDKEAIFEYIIHQKKEFARRMKDYERQKNKERNDLVELAKAEKEAKAQAFVQIEKNIVSKPSCSGFSGKKNKSGNDNGDVKATQLPSFWIPSLTPDSKDVKVKKPENIVLCPMSRKSIKAKDLIPISFIPINDPDDKAALITKKNRFKCAVTHDALGNHVPCAVLRSSGNVVTMECVEKLIRKDMIDPTNGKRITEKDIIAIQRGGTGYASTNEKLDARLKKPVMMA